MVEEVLMSPISSNDSESDENEKSTERQPKPTFKAPKASCLNHRAHLTFIR